MNKRTLCETIVDTIDNMKFIGENKEQQIKAIEGLISTLQPKNAIQFANWGQPNQQSKVEECWK